MEEVELVSQALKTVIENTAVNDKNLAELYRELKILRNKVNTYENAFEGDYDTLKKIIKFYENTYENTNEQHNADVKMSLELRLLLMAAKYKFVNYVENYDGDIIEHFLNVARIGGTICLGITALTISGICYGLYQSYI